MAKPSSSSDIKIFCTDFLNGKEVYLESIATANAVYYDFGEYADSGNVRCVVLNICGDLLVSTCSYEHILLVLGFIKFIYDENRYSLWFEMKHVLSPLIDGLILLEFNIATFRLHFVPATSYYTRFLGVLNGINGYITTFLSKCKSYF